MSELKLKKSLRRRLIWPQWDEWAERRLYSRQGTTFMNRRKVTSWIGNAWCGDKPQGSDNANEASSTETFPTDWWTSGEKTRKSPQREKPFTHFSTFVLRLCVKCVFPLQPEMKRRLAAITLQQRVTFHRPSPLVSPLSLLHYRFTSTSRGNTPGLMCAAPKRCCSFYTQTYT